jgi:hypothetical protein
MSKKVAREWLSKIKSLRDLQFRAETEPRYKRLAMIAANNLGGPCSDFNSAMETLSINAMELEMEGTCPETECGIDGEEAIVDEVNNVRDIEAEEKS